MRGITGLLWTLVLDGTRSQLVARIAHCTASQQTWLETASLVVFEILRSKPIVVKSLTFQCHVTSLVSWPFDCPYSYWWSFGTKLVSNFFRDVVDMTLNNL